MKKGAGTLPNLRAEATRAGLEMSDLADEINYLHQVRFGKSLGMSVDVLSSRFRGKSPWKLIEALLICDVLGISKTIENLETYFFDMDKKGGLSCKKTRRTSGAVQV